MSASEDLLYKLALNYIPNIGAVKAKDLVSYCGGIKEVFHTNKRKLMSIPGISDVRANDVLNSEALNKAEQEMKALEGKDIRLISYLDDNYPENLKHYPDSPLLLYCKGNMNLDAPRMVAIVGTRKITPYGIVQCQQLVEQLVQFECTIISGMAYGVDTHAHRNSLEMGIPTIGILGNGLNRVYPAANRKLAERMLETGGLISEFPLDAKPDRENFPMRNRIIAGMADVVIVVESALSGGSMITAEIANNYNKDVFAIPGKLTDEHSAGCNHLIKIHKAHLLTSADDISYIMRWDKQAEPRQLSLMIDLEPEEQEIVNILKANPNVGLDTLHYKTGIALATLTSLLLNLEFKGVLRSLPGKKYILSN